MRSDDIAIRVQGLGKKFLVPQKHEQDFSRAPSWHARLKEFFPSFLGADEFDFFWALRDVSFEVRRGEVMGIVGENGSGKSTLLKILSGITPPTEGVAEIYGRVGSLLEVGTGFHPDMTGRENIFFNGALLGVPTSKIRSMLNDIIEFSGIGDFIDVPVKRYSSGMYVRLAYSVASLLQSEIMILDEVLAVGDANFREKSEQNIKSSTASGRTVLIVSHNPRSIATICDRAIILYKGRVVFSGDAKDTMAEYLSNAYREVEGDDGSEAMPGQATRPEAELVDGSSVVAVDQTAQNADEDVDDPSLSLVDAEGSEGATESQSDQRQPMAKPRTARSFVNISKAPRPRDLGVSKPWKALKWVSVHGSDGVGRAVFSTGESVRIRIGYDGLLDPENAYFCLVINNSAGDRMTTVFSTDNGHIEGTPAKGVVECTIHSFMLGIGLYSIGIDVGIHDPRADSYVCWDSVAYATFIRVKDIGVLKGAPRTEFQGVPLRTEWTTAGSPVEHSEVDASVA